jgi:hypothetical protein
VHQFLPARDAAPAFDEADMSLRYASFESQIELALAARFTPVTHEFA